MFTLANTPKNKFITNLWALIAIDHEGWSSVIKFGPHLLWNEYGLYNDFVESKIMLQKQKPGVYWWHGYCQIVNYGDESTLEWNGSWTEEPIKK